MECGVTWKTNRADSWCVSIRSICLPVRNAVTESQSMPLGGGPITATSFSIWRLACSVKYSWRHENEKSHVKHGSGAHHEDRDHIECRNFTRAAIFCLCRDQRGQIALARRSGRDA